jgi:putative salt-induced outer membrane protein
MRAESILSSGKKMFKRTIFVIGFLLTAVAAPAYADEEESPWAGKVSFGYLATSGNTENSNLNTAFEVGYTPGLWAHVLKGLAIYATESNATTSEAYELGWKSERNFSEKNFLFGRFDWRKDRFSTYDKQFSQTVGYGRRLITNEKHNLSVEVGVGARQSDLVIGTSENEVIFRGGLNYAWALSETAEFTQDLGVEAGDKNTYLESKTAVSARLVGNLALVASYTIKHNTDVLPTTEKTDTYTALSLAYLF